MVMYWAGVEEYSSHGWTRLQGRRAEEHSLTCVSLFDSDTDFLRKYVKSSYLLLPLLLTFSLEKVTKTFFLDIKYLQIFTE